MYAAPFAAASTLPIAPVGSFPVVDVGETAHARHLGICVSANRLQQLRRWRARGECLQCHR